MAGSTAPTGATTPSTTAPRPPTAVARWARCPRPASVSGLHEHFFNYAGDTLAVGTGDVLFAYVYLDPASPPSEVMLGWNADGWEHRAYWGADSINYGSADTDSRRAMGALPAAGQWV